MRAQPDLFGAIGGLSLMGHFTAIGMQRDRYPTPAGAVVIDTCSGNDTADAGTDHQWTFANPTNRAIRHEHHDASAPSVECLWQGLKVFPPATGPDDATLAGDWRRGKGVVRRRKGLPERPAGHWDGQGQPLLADAGSARRAIYIPAYARLLDHWMRNHAVADRVARARAFRGPVFLRDWDTGRGVDRNGAVSHAWILAVWLNTGAWPT